MEVLLIWNVQLHSVALVICVCHTQMWLYCVGIVNTNASCKICLTTMYLDTSLSINTSAACMMITLLDNAHSGAKFLPAYHIYYIIYVAVWYCMMIEYRQRNLCLLYHNIIIIHLHSLPNGTKFLNAMASHARSVASLHHSRLRDFTIGLLVVYTTSWRLS